MPCAAVTAVGVVPTHRRRGLLTAMMRRQLEDVRARGEPVAMLWASEGAIYGRFGYGIAARDARLTAAAPVARLAAPPPVGDPLRGAAPAAGRRAHARRPRAYPPRRGPGMLDRPGAWWEARLHDPAQREGRAAAAGVLAVHDGYALYAVSPDRDDDGPAGEVTIRELVAATPAARALLWEFLLDQDLTRTITWPLAPTDEPLWLMLTDPDAVRVALEAALGAARRRAGRPLAPAVMRSTPTSCSTSPTPSAPGTPGATGWPAAAASAPTPEPDLALDAAALGAAYLGGDAAYELAAAGRVAELRPGALARASAAFRGDVAPWCPEIF